MSSQQQLLQTQVCYPSSKVRLRSASSELSQWPARTVAGSFTETARGSMSPGASGAPTNPTKLHSPDLVSGVRPQLLQPKGTAATCPVQGRLNKRSAATAGLAPTPPSASTEQDDGMASRMSGHGSESPKKNSPPSPCKKSKQSPKDVDWAEVTDPEERRRIQNRIAQRKFREKARENKEKTGRDSLNQEHAGNSYRIPSGADICSEPELSGLPWGSVSISHVISRGHEAESRRSSGRGTYVGDDNYPGGNNFARHGHGLHQTASYGSSGGDDAYYEDTTYLYDTAIAPQSFPA